MAIAMRTWDQGWNLEKRRRDPRLKLSSNLSVMIYVCIDTADFMSVLEVFGFSFRLSV